MKEKTGTYREPVQGHLEKGRERASGGASQIVCDADYQ